MNTPDPVPYAWEDLRLFLAIARHRTLSAAAHEVGVSQPTLGRRLRVLEAASGQPLLQRARQGFVPTEAGLVMIAHAERMEDETLALGRRLLGLEGRLEGLLRLSTSEWFGRHVLTPRLVAFGALHPQITIEVVSDTRRLSLERREADLIFRFRRFEEPEVIQRRLTTVSYALCASPDYIARHGPVTLASAGAGHRLITMDAAFGDLADVKWLSACLPKARLALRSNSRDIQAEACRAGAGLAVLPQVMAQAFGLVEVDLDPPPPGRDVWLGYHPDLKGLTRLRALVEHLT
jgi:DNA-binding transcriptional LysR family regulator